MENKIIKYKDNSHSKLFVPKSHQINLHNEKTKLTKTCSR